MAVDQKTKRGAAWRSPWVWAMVGFFLTVFAVNYGFVMVSSTTTTGLVTEEYYKYGLQQNKIDKQYRAQALRGWQIDLPLNHAWQVDETTTLRLSVRDKGGNYLGKGRAEITAYRPSDAKADVIVQLLETDQAGHYAGDLTMPLPGVWDINLLFSVDGKKHMLNHRIEVAGDGVAQSPSALDSVVRMLTGE